MFRLVTNSILPTFYQPSSLDILEKMKNKKPKLDIEKAVNKEINTPGSSDSKGKGADKKSKTKLKKAVGKKKHKSGKGMAVNKGRKEASSSSSRGKGKKPGKR